MKPTIINWTNVKDELPEDCKNILFIHDNKIRFGYLIEHFENDGEDFNYEVRTHSFYSNGYYYKEVTHWSYLPKLNEDDFKINNNWISCEEQTPPQYKDVLVLTDKKQKDIGVFDINEGWMLSRDDDFFEENVITHWMELP